MSYALIAGGSKGIGYAIAEALARRKYDLILLGRHTGALDAAKKKLENQFKISVETFCIDLSESAAAENVRAWCEEKKFHINFLCNVAGLGGNKDYLSLPLDDLRYMIRLNIESYMAMCLVLLPVLKKNTPSYILNVGSMAGFAPIPEKNLYSATKAAVISFSYSLKYQLKKDNISVSCLCPGPVFTKPEIIKTTIEKLGKFGEAMAVRPGRVGEIAVKNTLKGRMIIIPGKLSGLMSVLLRILPKRILAFIYSKMQ